MEFKINLTIKIFVSLMLILSIISACNENNGYSPKPRGYFRIKFPKKEYQEYKGVGPFTFIYPKYAIIDTDRTSIKSKKLLNMQSLLNMQFPQFNGTLHLSYETITSKKVFEQLTEDAHLFVYKHTVKASSINQGYIRYPERKVYGIYYTIDGNAASSLQFFITDSTKNYLRGALYFNTEPRLDSIQPVLTFVRNDVDVMIKSFRWK